MRAFVRPTVIVWHAIYRPSERYGVVGAIAEAENPRDAAFSLFRPRQARHARVEAFSAADADILQSIRGPRTCSPRLASPDPRLYASAAARLNPTYSLVPR